MLPRLFPGLQTERTVPLQGSNDRSTISMEEIRQIPVEEFREQEQWLQSFEDMKDKRSNS